MAPLGADGKAKASKPSDFAIILPSRLSTALDKLAKIRMKLETLQQQLEVQSQEVTSYYSALKAVRLHPAFCAVLSYLPCLFTTMHSDEFLAIVERCAV